MIIYEGACRTRHLLARLPQLVPAVAFCNFPGCAHLTTTWPSGLRRAVQVRVSQGAWVRIPPSSIFSFCLFPFRPPFFPLLLPFPFLPFSRRPLPESRGLSPGLPEFHPFRTGLFEAVSGPEARRRRASSPHTLLLLSRCAQGPSQVQHQPAGTGPQTEGASKGNFAPCSQD